MNLLAQIICSDLVIVFYICYHAGGSTKHLRPPKVKRLDEESSPSDALTPKIRKTRLAGKMRTYLWACPLTPRPPLKEKIIKIKTLLTPQVVKGSMSALVEKLKTERKEGEGNSGLKETLSRLFYN